VLGGVDGQLRELWVRAVADVDVAAGILLQGGSQRRARAVGARGVGGRPLGGRLLGGRPVAGRPLVPSPHAMATPGRLGLALFAGSSGGPARQRPPPQACLQLAVGSGPSLSGWHTIRKSLSRSSISSANRLLGCTAPAAWRGRGGERRPGGGSAAPQSCETMRRMAAVHPSSSTPGTGSVHPRCSLTLRPLKSVTQNTSCVPQQRAMGGRAGMGGGSVPAAACNRRPGVPARPCTLLQLLTAPRAGSAEWVGSGAAAMRCDCTPAHGAGCQHARPGASHTSASPSSVQVSVAVCTRSPRPFMTQAITRSSPG
jgi:hypothetical protein